METSNKFQLGAGQNPAITWLNMSGDVTVSWDKDNEEQVLRLIEKKMKEGYSFFIVKPRFFGLLGKKEVVAENVAQLRQAGAAILKTKTVSKVVTQLDDADLEAAVAQGAAKLVAPDSAARRAERRAMSAAEVLVHQTVAVRPIVGG